MSLSLLSSLAASRAYQTPASTQARREAAQQTSQTAPTAQPASSRRTAPAVQVTLSSQALALLSGQPSEAGPERSTQPPAADKATTTAPTAPTTATAFQAFLNGIGQTSDPVATTAAPAQASSVPDRPAATPVGSRLDIRI
jgi:hypothetical protein